jgi:hypothetical protein
MDRAVIEAEEKEAVAILQRELGLAAPKGNRLNLPGEALMGFLASQIVLPIICGLLDAKIYEKWFGKGLLLSSKSDAEAVRQDAETVPHPQAFVVSNDVLVGDICKMLENRKIDKATARTIADEILGRIQGRLQEAPSKPLKDSEQAS